MAIVPFKLKPKSETQAKERENLLINQIVQRVVDEMRLYIPAPIPGKQGERGEQGIPGPVGSQGPSGLDGKDGKDALVSDL